MLDLWRGTTLAIFQSRRRKLFSCDCWKAFQIIDEQHDVYWKPRSSEVAPMWGVCFQVFDRFDHAIVIKNSGSHHNKIKMFNMSSGFVSSSRKGCAQRPNLTCWCTAHLVERFLQNQEDWLCYHFLDWTRAWTFFLYPTLVSKAVSYLKKYLWHSLWQQYIWRKRVRRLPNDRDLKTILLSGMCIFFSYLTNVLCGGNTTAHHCQIIVRVGMHFFVYFFNLGYK